MDSQLTKLSSSVRKRQWGAEKRTAPMPILHEKPSTLKLALGRIAIVLTIVFWVLYVFSIIIRQLIDGPQNYNFMVEAFSYALVVSFLTFSALMYLIARHGALLNFSKHERTPRALLEQFFSKKRPTITVLVPGLNEEYKVVRQTILSAALQEFPNIKVVLLLDSNPNPTDPAEQQKLEQTRKIDLDTKEFLSEPYQRFLHAQKKFLSQNKQVIANPEEIQEISDHFAWGATWLWKKANNETVEDHVDNFFAKEILAKLGNDFDLTAKALAMSKTDKGQISKEKLIELYNRLVWTFKADVEVFERKQYTNLSHEKNKAMNLNSYIGLMGGTYREEKTQAGTFLLPDDGKQYKHKNIPDSDYLLTLDTDSILLREYCLRLVYFLEQPENATVAITQTPYSSFRGSPTRIERLAAATTDVQHILHQGMSHFGAAFWVGANAVIRKKALKDIVETEIVNGFKIQRFVQDRTVIEDTESSIDMTFNNWRLVNYPERLSYSATPPDFGTLVVQRRRWANGGLLILPKFLSQVRDRKQKGNPVSRTEMMLRINYMASIAWSTFGLLFLLAYPYDGRLLSPLVLLAAIPYFLAMASDLKYCGYNYTDVFRIYGFNLIMLPVNLAGVLKSLEQAITGKKIPFARTPKVKNRAPAGFLFVIVPPLIVAFSLFTVHRNIEMQNWGNAAFAAFNAFAASWAIVAYIGLGNLLADIWLGLTDWLYVEEKSKTKKHKQVATKNVDWKVVLYHGDTKGEIPHSALGAV